ncbi:MAG: exodeoxyribonuclease V subunit alpha [Mariprofundaceae bacterium]
MIDLYDGESKQHALSKFFARFIAQQGDENMQSVLARSAAWLVQLQVEGHVCLDLNQCAESLWPDGDTYSHKLNDWREALLSSPCVGLPGAHAPMILDQQRLYLSRFWNYEDIVSRVLESYLHSAPVLDEVKLQNGLQRLFDYSKPDKEINWQMVAAALAVSRQFSVISGGPGTGKTTSLVKVLALLLEQQADMKIRIAAPTGKAAARMVESIRAAKSVIDTDECTRSNIPDQASTLHRLLGYSPRGYKHDKHYPLMLDCLVIDEASMLDLPMMARLLEALPAHARLILLGDRDQLASVDAGNVLGDITGHGHEISYGKNTITQLARLTGLDEVCLPLNDQAPEIANSIALLRKSYRFKSDGGIGKLAADVNSGDAQAALATFKSAEGDELNWRQGATLTALIERLVQSFSTYLKEPDVTVAMGLFEKLRVLCAVRKGPVGVESINHAIASGLIAAGLLNSGDAVHGMPILVTSNNYELDLFNGDIGLLWRNEEGQLRAYFRQQGDQLRDIPAQSITQYEAAWAMTVHKSQGSEFDAVTLILPEEGHQLLTRELLYTAITRARKQFSLHANKAVIEMTIAQTVNRSTGLSSRLKW